MARVWRAWDPSLQRYVALKEPLFDPRYSPEVLEEVGHRFVREAQVGARLRGHPGIVAVYGADVYDGRPAVAMELVDGATLGEILENGPLEQSAALDVLDQLLDAVGYAHSLGIVHRDLKPDNIFVDKFGRVKVADFGIAGVNDSSYVKATVVSVVLGTPGYMSPEQAMGLPADARSDFFSIGVIAYEMLAGRNPFGLGDGADSTELLYRIVHEPVPPLPDAVSASLPAGYRSAIMAALSKDPQGRPIDAATFKEMLHDGRVEERPGVAPASPVVLGATQAVASGASADGKAALGVGPTPPSTYAPSKAAGGAAFGAGAVAASREKGGTLVMPVDPRFDMPSSASATAARWAPIVAIAAVCVILLVGLLVTTLPSGGGASGGAAASGSPAASASAVAQSALAEPSAESSPASEPDSSTSLSTSGEADAAPSAEAEAEVESGGETGSEPPATAAAPEPVQEEPVADEPVVETDYDYSYDSGVYDDYAPAGEFWGVWIDSFYDMGAAYACADEANASGMPANVFEIAGEDGSYYVVSAGEFSTRTEAEAVVSQARQLGFYNAYTSTATYL